MAQQQPVTVLVSTAVAISTSGLRPLDITLELSDQSCMIYCDFFILSSDVLDSESIDANWPKTLTIYCSAGRSQGVAAVAKATPSPL